MRIQTFDDTICALATAQGVGAIAMIRISGSGTYKIADKIFYSKNNKKLSEQPPYTLHFGEIRGEKPIDEVLVSCFRAPRSYTGEDMIEISCHGSVYIQQQILKLCVENGARLARPGEFTQRAFVHGKMDLSQAEAVADLIATENEAMHTIALHQLKGGFALQIRELRKQLLWFVSLIELELDFSEEDVEFANREQMLTLILKIEDVVTKLINSFDSGNAIKNGVPVAIVGEPNVGKSTLLNVLLNEDRAIVSEIAGTTRDSIEDCMTINGIKFRFIDTAGLRNTTDTIEALGIERSIHKIKQATIILLLVNASEKFETIDNQIKQVLAYMHQGTGRKELILVVNKIDQAPMLHEGLMNMLEAMYSQFAMVSIAAKQSRNIDQLQNTIVIKSQINTTTHGEVVITNIRHFEALSRAYESILRIKSGIADHIFTEFLSQDLRLVLDYLGEISGEITNDEILGNIFKNFCIGK